MNGKGTRITPLVSHGIKSRVAEILRFPVYPDELQKEASRPAGHSVGFQIEVTNNWVGRYR